MSAVVIPLIHQRQAKARGVFEQVRNAGCRLGMKEHFASEYAKRARDDYNRGGRSPAIVISDWSATLRAAVRQVHG